MPKVFSYRRPRDIPSGVVRCDRKTQYGNPFIVGRHGSRDEVCDRFETEILPDLDVSELRGKDLVCWCAPLRCHCDAILVKANG